MVEPDNMNIDAGIDIDSLVDQAMAEHDFNLAQALAPDVKTLKRFDDGEYLEFLQEISDEDASLAKADLEAASRENMFDEVNEEESEDPQSETELDLEAEIEPQVTTQEAVSDEDMLLREAILKHRREVFYSFSMSWKLKKKQEKIKIRRMAFDQTVLPLGAEMTLEDKKLLIKLLTSHLHKMISRCDAYIHARTTKLLLPLVPREVKLAYEKWPWIFVSNPGFLYKTHEHSGPIQTFWINPKIPYYFQQGTEQQILEEYDASLSVYLLDCLDRAVHKYYYYKDRLIKKEVQYARKLAYMRGRTYYHLLMLNPFWFNVLYKNKVDNEK